jgi:hypothetical protein
VREGGCKVLPAFIKCQPDGLRCGIWCEVDQWLQFTKKAGLSAQPFLTLSGEFYEFSPGVTVMLKLSKGSSV